MFEDDLSVVAILPGLISSSFLSFQRNFSSVTLDPFFFLVSQNLSLTFIRTLLKATMSNSCSSSSTL